MSVSLALQILQTGLSSWAGGLQCTVGQLGLEVHCLFPFLFSSLPCVLVCSSLQLSWHLWSAYCVPGPQNCSRYQRFLFFSPVPSLMSTLSLP